MNEYHWCKTAFGTAMNMSSALKSELPIGIGDIFTEFLYDEILDDELIEILLRPGCTSLNEACNKIINAYANKKRFLGPLSYTHAVARGVLQWNMSYMHLLKELKYFGISLAKIHKQWFVKQMAKRNYNSYWSTSHKRNLKKHQRKYKLAQLDCAYTSGSQLFYKK